MAVERLLYCLTRDTALADALDRTESHLAFFYNDAARLSLAVALRAPDVIVVDTGAIRPEYGDEGLGPVLDQLRTRVPQARLAVRPGPGADRLVAAEAGPEVTMLPSDRERCVSAVSALDGTAA